MIITVEVSYYPLQENYDTQILEFINLLKSNTRITTETGKMSSLVTGELEEVMKVLTESMEAMMLKNASVFNFKISNTCIRS